MCLFLPKLYLIWKQTRHRIGETAPRRDPASGETLHRLHNITNKYDFDIYVRIKPKVGGKAGKPSGPGISFSEIKNTQAGLYFTPVCGNTELRPAGSYSPRQTTKYSNKTTFRVVFLWRGRLILAVETGTRKKCSRHSLPGCFKLSIICSPYFLMTQLLRADEGLLDKQVYQEVEPPT